MSNEAFDALKTYDWGTDPSVLNLINDAVVATHGNAAARHELEVRLVEVLKSGVSRAAKDYVCRTLTVIGTAESVPALAALLADKDLSHMARYALERIPAAEAAQAMRDALPKLSGTLKVGIIGSLGVRGDTASVPALATLLGAADPAVARSAAIALGMIGNAEAAKTLTEVKPADADVKLIVVDARLACAERYVVAGKKAEAAAIYEALVGSGQPKHVRVAATHGMLQCAGN